MLYFYAAIIQHTWMLFTNIVLFSAHALYFDFSRLWGKYNPSVIIDLLLNVQALKFAAL